LEKNKFTYKRLPYGIRAIDGKLQGIPNVIVYLDDILVTGRNEDEHLKNLDTVLK
jgi:hypothetical protein